MPRLLQPRWIGFHLLMLGLIAAQAWLARWQWVRAEGGGGLQSLGYAIQWPVFAAFTAFFWWRTVRDELRPREQLRGAKWDVEAVVSAPRRTAADVDDSDDPELAAYNARLAALAERPRR